MFKQHTQMPCLPSPQPIALDLVSLGVATLLAQKISFLYLQKAEAFKKAVEAIIDSKLASIPCTSDSLEFEIVSHRLFASHERNYTEILHQWIADAVDFAQSHKVPISNKTPCCQKKPSRSFRAEYLPLFEYAFSKDRFPSREDKKHLAYISGMSYRQVSVWFQNRRCRTGKAAPIDIPLKPKQPSLRSGKSSNSIKSSTFDLIPDANLIGYKNTQAGLYPLVPEDIRKETLEGKRRLLDDQNPSGVPFLILKTDALYQFPTPYNPSTPSADPFTIKTDPSLWNRRRGSNCVKVRERKVELGEVIQDMETMNVNSCMVDSTERRIVGPLHKRCYPDYFAIPSQLAFSSQRTDSSSTASSDISKSSMSFSSPVPIDTNNPLTGDVYCWNEDRHNIDEFPSSSPYSYVNSSSDSLSSIHENLELGLDSSDFSEDLDLAYRQKDTLNTFSTISSGLQAMLHLTAKKLSPRDVMS